MIPDRFELHTPKGHPWHTLIKDAYIMAEPLRVSTSTDSAWCQARPSGEQDTWILTILMRIE